MATVPVDLRVTNDGFADAVGIHFTTASKLRNGRRRPSLDLCVRIADAYDLDLEELVRAADDAESFGQLLREQVFGET